MDAPAVRQLTGFPSYRQAALWRCPTLACFRRQLAGAVVAPVSETKADGKPKPPVPTLVYLPLPKQVDYEMSGARYLLYGGAAGVTKSHAARWRQYKLALRIPGYEALLLRRTFPELEKTHFRRMTSEVPLLGGEFIETKRIAKFRHPGGAVSVIEGGHMDDPADVEKYLSTEYDDITCDEGSTFEPEALLALSTRARSTKAGVLADAMARGASTVAGGATFRVPTNPGGPSAAVLLDFFIDHAPDFDTFPALRETYDPAQWGYLPGVWTDNPYLDAAYWDALAVLPAWRYEQLRHGDWRVFSGQFFSQWNTRRHVVDLGTPTGVRWFRSLDWGRNQPGCVLWWAILPDGRLYIRRDLKFQGMDESEVAAQIHRVDADLGVRQVAYTACDPAIFNKTGASHQAHHQVGQSIGDTLRIYGINAVPGDNARVLGWARCHAILRDAPDGQPWCVVHPDARYLIRSIPAQMSEVRDPDDVNTAGDDHAVDAWRYGAMSQPRPGQPATAAPFKVGTIGWMKQQLAGSGRHVLGRESVRRSA